jgi:hypothetical protein
VVIPLPDEPAPLAATPSPIVLSRPAGGQVVVRSVPIRLQSGPTMRWTVFVRARFNEPVTVTQLTAEVDGQASALGTNTAISYGDLAFLLADGATPAAGQTANLTVAGTDRAGAAFEQTLTVTLPAPTMN